MSYCASLSFKQIGKKEVSLDFWPKGNDGSEFICVKLSSSADNFASKVKECKTLEELKNLLLNEVNLYELFSCDVGSKEMPTSEFIKELENADDCYEDLVNEVTATYNKFKESLGKIANLNDIESISVDEYYTGCGDPDDAMEFFNAVIGDPTEFEYEEDDEIMIDEQAALEGKLTEKEQNMLECVMIGECDGFDANIITTINMKTGEATTKYSFESF